MKGLVFALVVATATLTVSTASAQQTAHPFGLTFGTSLAEMKKLIPDLVSIETKILYTATSVPTPYPGFERYGFAITPTHGLCKVAAMGTTIEDDPYGTTTRSRFRELQDALTKKYGEPFVVDSLIADTYLKGPEYWATTLSEKARVFSAVWPKGDGPLGFGLSGIELDAMGLSSSSTSLILTYWGEKFEACMERLEEAL